MQVPITSEAVLMFGTPIVLRTVANAAALNAELERVILDRARAGAGSRISNIGGWQSTPDLLDLPEPSISQFKAEVDRGIQSISALPAAVEGRAPGKRVEYNSYGWANINQHGHYNTLHVHTGNDWSVVYYVDPGRPSPDTSTNGRIELRDPRPMAVYSRTPGFTEGQPMQIKPQAGLMIIFPSWIEHWVHPFHGEGNRISIAVNVALLRE